MVARPASAEIITPRNLDEFDTSAPFGPSLLVDFSSSMGGGTNGELTTQVFYDGATYFYTQTINPAQNANFVFLTEFDVVGFTGQAGWRFADSGAAGAGGNANDFLINESETGSLVWVALPGGAFGEWNAFEPITFFFASTLPPAIDSYTLLSLDPREFGTAFGFAPAPVPEPGSIALFGSGLVGLYAALRRRRAERM